MNGTARCLSFALLGALLASCAVAPPIRGRSQTLAFDNAAHGHLRLRANAVDYREDGADDVQVLAVDAAAGAPVDAAIDPGFGYGAIAYERALWFVDAQLVPPAPTPCEAPAFPIRRVAIVGQRLVATGDDRVALYEAQQVDGAMVWALQDTCSKPRRVQQLALAVPWQERDYAVVGMVDGEPAVVRVSRRDGPWRMGSPNVLADIDELCAVRNLGRRLVIFGLERTTSMPNTPGPASMKVELRGFTADSDDMRMDQKMQMGDSERPGIEVTDLALSQRHAVLVVDGVQLRSYAITGDGLRWARGESPLVSRRVDVEWVGGNRFTYQSDGGQPKLLELATDDS